MQPYYAHVCADSSFTPYSFNLSKVTICSIGIHALFEKWNDKLISQDNLYMTYPLVCYHSSSNIDRNILSTQKYKSRVSLPTRRQFTTSASARSAFACIYYFARCITRMCVCVIVALVLSSYLCGICSPCSRRLSSSLRYRARDNFVRSIIMLIFSTFHPFLFTFSFRVSVNNIVYSSSPLFLFISFRESH